MLIPFLSLRWGMKEADLPSVFQSTQEVSQCIGSPYKFNLIEDLVFGFHGLPSYHTVLIGL